MKHPARSCFATFGFALLVLLACQCASVPAQAAVQTYGTLLSYDFDTTAWTGAITEAVGTIDTPGSTQASLGLRSASLIASGPLPLTITETNLGKFTLAFSLSASSAKPVTVTIESYNASKTRTGGLQTLVYPAAPDFYQRYAVDLSTCKPSGTGTFQPNAPYVSFSFSTQDPSWQGVSRPEVRVDNLNYALPAYYVSTTGKNSNTGRSEAQAFLTPQKALDVAQAGDIIDVMAGMYIDPNGPTPSTTFPNADVSSGGLGSVAQFQRTGTPANWIALKNYPGQQPTFFSNGWNIINMTKGYGGHPSSVPLSYLEVRGIHIRGEGDEIRFNGKYADSVGQVDSRSNSNGIAISGDNMTVKPHHLRLADNFVEYCPGAGLGSGNADWVQIENNVVRNNAWMSKYAESGISISGTFNFDATDNVYKRLIRNNICSGNQAFVPWDALNPPAISDGNGIIMDVNNGVGSNIGAVPVTDPSTQYIGRTLVQSNLSFNNGGGGVHAYRANRVDIINNTAYLNSASPELQYAQIDANTGDDDRIINNILVAPVANTAAGEKAEPVNGGGSAAHNIVFSHNLYFGGNTAPTMGTGDVVADPKFVNPTRDSNTADFHLQTTSPALATAITQTYSPFLDLDARIRNAAAPDKGAYELTTTTTTLASSANPAPQGASITLTATVNGNAPTGNVTFTDAGTTLGTATLTNGIATLVTTTLGMGSHTLQAAYAADTGNTPSTSPTLTQAIKGPPTATNQSVTTLINHAATVALSGTDPNTPTLALTYTVTTAPAHGTLSGTAPTLTYTPAPGYSGADSFAFTVSNGYLTSSPASVSITVTLASVSGTVSLQAWTGTSQPLTFTLTPTGSTGGSVSTQTLTPGTGGAFSLANVSPGTYSLGVKGSKWLRKSLSVDTTGGSVSGLSFGLLTGDVNGDNYVSSTDYLILRNAYGSTPASATWDARADLNGDSYVSSTDYLLLRANYGVQGAP